MSTTNDAYGKLINAAEVRFERLLPGPVERVWEYITDPQKRRLWFAGGTTDLKVGGKMTLEFHNKELAPDGEGLPEKYREHAKDGIRFDVIVTACEPHRRFGFQWDQSEVIIDLASQGDKVQLTLTHRKLPNRKEAVDVSGGWHVHLAALEARLTGNPLPPFWTRLEKLEAEYEKRIP